MLQCENPLILSFQYRERFYTALDNTDDIKKLDIIYSQISSYWTDGKLIDPDYYAVTRWYETKKQIIKGRQ